MIEIAMTGMCKDCEHADLELESNELQSGQGTITLWEIICTHQDKCEEWCNMLRGKSKWI